jgi:hypothetical protein
VSRSLDDGADAVYLRLYQSSDGTVCAAAADGAVPEDGSRFTLDDAFASFPETPFILDICGDSLTLTRAVCASVKKSGADGRVLLFSCYSRQLNIASKISPGLPAAFSISGVTGYYAMFRTGLLFFKRKFRRAAILTTEFIGPSYIANQGLVQSAVDRGLSVFIFGASGQEQFRRLTDAGVAGFITTDVKGAREILNSQS